MNKRNHPSAKKNKARAPIVARALEAEGQHAMRVANRLRFAFLAILSALIIAFRNDPSTAASIVALALFWLVATVNALVLRRGGSGLASAFNYAVVVLDCAIVFMMILIQSRSASGLADYALALKNENYWLLLFPVIVQGLMLRSRPVIVSIGFTILIQYCLVALAMTNGVELTSSFPEARTSDKVYLLDALLKRPAILLAIGMIILYGIRRSISLATRLGETNQRNVVLSRYFSPNVLEAISSDPDLVNRARRQIVAILFIDIRDFTRMSESLDPDELVAFLADFRERVVSIVLKAGGSIDKFIGDAVLATFGTPTPATEAHIDSSNGLRAALDIRKQVLAINVRRREADMEAIRIGMGLHRGEVIAGSIGNGELLEYSVFGDVVNTASRIEDLCKQHRTDLLISSSVYEDIDPVLRHDISVLPLPRTEIRGKQKGIDLYEVI